MIIKLDEYLLQNPQINQLIMELMTIHNGLKVYDTAFAAYCEEEAARRLNRTTSDDAVHEVALKIGKYLSNNDAVNDAIDNIVAKRCYQ